MEIILNPYSCHPQTCWGLPLREGQGQADSHRAEVVLWSHPPQPTLQAGVQHSHSGALGHENQYCQLNHPSHQQIKIDLQPGHGAWEGDAAHGPSSYGNKRTLLERTTETSLLDAKCKQ